jgi:hypothetical protein
MSIEQREIADDRRELDPNIVFKGDRNAELAGRSREWLNDELHGHRHRFRDAIWRVLRVAGDIRDFMRLYGDEVDDLEIDPKFVGLMKNVAREMWRVHQSLHLDTHEERVRVVAEAERAAKRRGVGRDFEALDYGMGLVDCELEPEQRRCSA